MGGVLETLGQEHAVFRRLAARPRNPALSDKG